MTPPHLEPGESTGWIAAIAGAIGGLMMLRRRLSRDSTEISKDRTESGLYERVLKERDRAEADAREAWATRTKDAETIARLAAQTESQAREIERLRLEFAAFRRMVVRLHPELAPIVGSDDGDLADR